MRAASVMLCVLILLGVRCHVSAAQDAPTAPTIKAICTVDGYFITEDRRLVRRELQMASTTPHPQEKLHLTRSRYAVRIDVTSSVPLSHVKVLLPDGQTAWEEDIAPAATRRHLPGSSRGELSEEATSIVITPNEELLLRVQALTETDIALETVVKPSDVHLRPAPSIAVNWLDLMRVEAVRAWLRRDGRGFLRDVAIDTQPFMLATEDGRALMGGTADPPQRFRRYRGISPTRHDLYVDNSTRFNPAGPNTIVGGYPTAQFPYDPLWSLRENQPGPPYLDERAIVAVLHEMVHVSHISRMPSTPGLDDVAVDQNLPSVEVAVLTTIEGLALRDAAMGPEEVCRRALMDYVSLRRERLRQTGRCDVLGALATLEAFAYLATAVAEHAREEGTNASVAGNEEELRSALAPQAKRFFNELAERGEDATRARPRMFSNAHYAHGIAAMILALRIAPDAIERVWGEGALLADVLEEMSGYREFGTAARAEALSAALARWDYSGRVRRQYDRERDGRRDFLTRIRGIRSGAEGRLMEIRIREAVTSADAPSAEGSLRSRYLDPMDWFGRNDHISSTAPCLVKEEIHGNHRQLQFLMLLPTDSNPLWVGLQDKHALILGERFQLRLNNPRFRQTDDRLLIVADGVGDPGSVPGTALADLLPKENTFYLLMDGSGENQDTVFTLHSITSSLTGAFSINDSLVWHGTVTQNVPQPADAEVSLLKGRTYSLDVEVESAPGDSTVGELTVHALGADAVGVAGSGRHRVAVARTFIADADFALEAPRLNVRGEGGALDFAYFMVSNKLNLRLHEVSYLRNGDGMVRRSSAVAAGDVPLKVWPEGRPERAINVATTDDGLLQMPNIDANVVMVEAHSTQHCRTRFRLPVWRQAEHDAYLIRHTGGEGLIFVRHSREQPVDPPEVELWLGDARLITLEAERYDTFTAGGETVFRYSFSALPAGQYTVRARYGASEMQAIVDMPNDCLRFAQEGQLNLEAPGGSHFPVIAPVIIFGEH